jgi:hypothetical protein
MRGSLPNMDKTIKVLWGFSAICFPAQTKQEELMVEFLVFATPNP